MSKATLKNAKPRADVLTLTGLPLEMELAAYLSQGWRLACYSWGYAFIVKGA